MRHYLLQSEEHTVHLTRSIYERRSFQPVDAKIPKISGCHITAKN